MNRFAALQVFFILTLLSFSGFSQRYYGVSQERFGKSKIQNKNFQWRTFSSASYEYNFYKGGERIAKNSAEYLEQHYRKVTDLLGYIPYEPVKIFIFNSLADINSTNLAGTNNEIENGTLVNVKDFRILTSFDKNDSLFNKRLLKDVTSIYLFDMLYGGGVRESIESQILLNLPPWFSRGAAAFVSEGNNSQLYETFKATILANDSKRLSSLSGKDAELIGQSIWNYIAIKYGKNSISNILNLTRIIHDEQSSITSTLGVPFQKFLKEWRDFYVLGEQQTEKTVVEIEPDVIPKRISDLQPGEIDTDNYIFDEESLKQYENLKSLLSSNSQAVGKSIDKTLNKGRFSSTKLFKNFLLDDKRKMEVLVDPVREFGIGYSIGFSDLLKNNIFAFTSYLKPTSPMFKSFDFKLFYGNYTNKIDYEFSYEKRSINFRTVDDRDAFLFRPLNIIISGDSPQFLYQRLVSQTLATKIIYPVSEKIKVEIAPTFIKNSIIDYSFVSEGGSEYYFSPNLSLVFDNATSNIFGVENGTKAKVSFTRNYNFSDNLRNFHGMYIDVRHYQRIFKGLQVAGRLSYGTSKGNSPKFTYLGGVENAVSRSNYQTDETLQGGDSDLRNILFYNFPGNLHGFDFGRLFGNNHLLGNIEIRSHLAEILPQMALSSNMLRNLKLIGFYDIGTAWMGDKGPFSRQNSVNTTTSSNGPFVIEVTNFKNPFLSSFGAGIRTSILGISLRADYAVGLEDKNVNSGKFHLSFGKDF